MALLPGIVGELYRQFAVTLSTAVALSSLVALTLTPALCALLLRPRPARPAAVWRAFNRLLDGTRDGYGRLVGWMNRRPWLALAATVAAGALVAFSFTSMPKGFLPQEDQGYLFASVQLPEAASLERTEAVMAQARKLLMANPAVEDVIQVSGFNILNGTSASNGGFILGNAQGLASAAAAGCGDGGYSAPAAVATGGDDHDLRAADPAGPGQCLGV